MPAIVYLEPYRMIFVHSIRTIFVCSVRKTFGHLSDRRKKIKRYEAFTMGHYIGNKVFVSRCGKERALRQCRAVPVPTELKKSPTPTDERSKALAVRPFA